MKKGVIYIIVGLLIFLVTITGNIFYENHKNNISSDYHLKKCIRHRILEDKSINVDSVNIGINILQKLNGEYSNVAALTHLRDKFKRLNTDIEYEEFSEIFYRYKKEYANIVDTKDCFRNSVVYTYKINGGELRKDTAYFYTEHICYNASSNETFLKEIHNIVTILETTLQEKKIENDKNHPINLKLGDVVMLKSGGIKMTFLEKQGIFAHCVWSSQDGKLTYEKIHYKSLKKVE